MRRVLVDTNVLLAALVFPGGLAASAFSRVVDKERLALTQQILDEALDVVRRKWPDRVGALDRFLAALDFELLPVSPSKVEIRDPRDQPILDAALADGVDIILTGDKDFHALNLARPAVLDPRGYLATIE